MFWGVGLSRHYTTGTVAARPRTENINGLAETVFSERQTPTYQRTRKEAYLNKVARRLNRTATRDATI